MSNIFLNICVHSEVEGNVYHGACRYRILLNQEAKYTVVKTVARQTWDASECGRYTDEE